jgi:hypothetical protein
MSVRPENGKQTESAGGTAKKGDENYCFLFKLSNHIKKINLSDENAGRRENLPEGKIHSNFSTTSCVILTKRLLTKDNDGKILP